MPKLDKVQEMINAILYMGIMLNILVTEILSALFCIFYFRA